MARWWRLSKARLQWTVQGWKASRDSGMIDCYGSKVRVESLASMDQGDDEEQVKLGPMDFKGHTLLQTGHHSRFITPITATFGTRQWIVDRDDMVITVNWIICYTDGWQHKPLAMVVSRNPKGPKIAKFFVLIMGSHKSVDFSCENTHVVRWWGLNLRRCPCA